MSAMCEVTPELTLESMFSGGSEMAALIQSTFGEAISDGDAAQTTSLGAFSTWSAALKTAVSICLNSQFPVIVWWGEDFRLLYNDAFCPILGDRHPQALGCTAQSVFPESWHIIGPQLNSVFKTQSANRAENLLIPSLRSGYLEESYYTYSYSPLLTKSGKVSGVFTIINETTKQILSERRLVTSTQLADQAEPESDEIQTTEEIYQSIIKTLSENPIDIPFAALYWLNPAKTQAVLCGQTGSQTGSQTNGQTGGHILLPQVIDFAQQIDPWQFELVLHSRKAITMEDLPSRLSPSSVTAIPSGLFNLPVTEAQVMPIRALGLKSIVGMLIVGINPARRLDADYTAFLELMASHITSRINNAIANAQSQSTQQALKISEERFKSFVESNVVGMLFGDVDGTIEEANDELLRIVGYTREDVRAGLLRWTEITPPEYFPADEAGIAEALQTGSCTPYEKEYIRKDGSRVPVLVGYTLLGENKDKSAAFVLDVSDRKEIEESLQQRETELQIVTDTVPVMISFIDADQRYRFNNQRYEEWFGCSASALYGKHIREVLGRAGYEKVRPYVDQVLAGQQVSYENEFSLNGGEPHYLNVTYTPRFNASGAVEGFVSMASDVSDRKRIEAEREQLLQREYAAREAAERANRIKDEFLAVVSHELRTPMNPILGWSQLLKRGNLSAEKIALALETIERNARSQVQLIDDLLDISRVLRGKMTLAENPINLSPIVSAALETVRLAAEAKSISIKTTLLPCMVNGDEGRLQQVMWNLLSNAVKFTPEGGQISVDLRPEGRAAQIKVIDTGQGISTDFLPYVFEHFRQEDYSTTRQFGGLGLGLAIVRQVAELHGGSVAVTSAGENQGATFTVRIPLAAKNAVDSLAPEPASAQKDLSGLHILVVDDEADSQAITAFALEQSGAVVTIAAGGAEALASIRQRVPDLIVSDIAMPEMDGYALIRQIRALPAEQGGGILAIALTAYAGEVDLKRAISAGFQRHVAKPIDPEKLVEIIANTPSDRPS